MLTRLEKIFETLYIEGPENKRLPLHSNTSKEQGYFIQSIFDMIKPQRPVEVGLAYGISTLFILEKHRQYNNRAKCHLVIEPYPWGGIAEHNIALENLQDFVDIRYDLSDKVLPKLYLDGYSIQFAYIDTTKLFDTVLQDFYFIDKILDVKGVIIFDDCGAGCPGVQRVARFIATLPHYKVYASHNKAPQSLKRRIASNVVRTFVKMIPFKTEFYPTIGFNTDEELGLDSSCIVFQKIERDNRKWDWDARF